VERRERERGERDKRGGKGRGRERGRVCIVITRSKVSEKVVKCINELLCTDDAISKTSIVSCKWLEDSIAEFTVKNFEGY
jgi:hypothetical protein